MASSQSNEKDDRPPPIPGVVRISRRQIAEWQIDNAILLWFREKEDVVSPHTLAVAAQGVLTALCRDMRQPLSKVVTWMNRKPKSFQEQLRNPQNFFKHGYHKQPFRDVASFTPQMTEVFLIDNVAVYQDLFGVLTIPMIVFALRFSIEHPKGLPLVAFQFADGKVLEATEIKKLAALSKEDFLEAALPLVAKRK
jgi:hypothetical protein